MNSRHTVGDPHVPELEGIIKSASVEKIPSDDDSMPHERPREERRSLDTAKTLLHVATITDLDVFFPDKITLCFELEELKFEFFSF